MTARILDVAIQANQVSQQQVCPEQVEQLKWWIIFICKVPPVCTKLHGVIRRRVANSGRCNMYTSILFWSIRVGCISLEVIYNCCGMHTLVRFHTNWWRLVVTTHQGRLLVTNHQERYLQVSWLLLAVWNMPFAVSVCHTTTRLFSPPLFHPFFWATTVHSILLLVIQ